MAKDLDREALIEGFQKDAKQAQEKIAALNERRPALVEKAAKAQSRVADLDNRIAAEQAKIDDLDKKVEWANSFPGADNAQPVAADTSFGDAQVPGDGEPVGEPV